MNAFYVYTSIIIPIHSVLELTVSPSNITVSEGGKVHICASLNGDLRDIANVSIETKDKHAMSMYASYIIHFYTIYMYFYIVFYALLCFLETTFFQ